jgi:hypothetical protein
LPISRFDPVLPLPCGLSRCGIAQVASKRLRAVSRSPGPPPREALSLDPQIDEVTHSSVAVPDEVAAAIRASLVWKNYADTVTLCDSTLAGE